MDREGKHGESEMGNENADGDVGVEVNEGKEEQGWWLRNVLNQRITLGTHRHQLGQTWMGCRNCYAV